jgi:hypothetical protein
MHGFWLRLWWGELTIWGFGGDFRVVRGLVVVVGVKVYLGRLFPNQVPPL